MWFDEGGWGCVLRVFGLLVGGKIRWKMDENWCWLWGIYGIRLVVSCNVGEDLCFGFCLYSSDGLVYD